MVLIQPSVTRDLRALLGPLFELAEGCEALIGTVAGSFVAQGRRHLIPRFLFSTAGAHSETIRLGIFAGLHGDEPAGCEAAVGFLADLVANPELARGYDIVVYPVCNPSGYLRGTRTNEAGLDLNREFWRESDQPEIHILEKELRQHRFHGIITLHSDDTCDGLYGYSHGRLMNEVLLRPALQDAARILPLDTRSRIDGFPANGGIIRECFCGILSAPPDQAEQPFDLIFETPAREDHRAQVEASITALHTMLREYRPYIAYGQNL